MEPLHIVEIGFFGFCKKSETNIFLVGFSFPGPETTSKNWPLFVSKKTAAPWFSSLASSSSAKKNRRMGRSCRVLLGAVIEINASKRIPGCTHVAWSIFFNTTLRCRDYSILSLVVAQR